MGHACPWAAMVSAYASAGNVSASGPVVKDAYDAVAAKLIALIPQDYFGDDDLY